MIFNRAGDEGLSGFLLLVLAALLLTAIFLGLAAFLRFTGGDRGGLLLGLSVILWLAVPVLLGTWRLKRRTCRKAHFATP